MEFPEPQTLSAGMSWTVPVTFRPVAREYYDDRIEFATSFGNFWLPIKATLPEHDLKFPEEIDFGYRPVNETAKMQFTLSNNGELSSYFEWEIEGPFTISPAKGELSPGSSCSISVQFKPTAAIVVTSVTKCNFGSKSNWAKSKLTKLMNIKAISKFSHIVCENSTISFGNITIGSKAETILTLQNPSAVVVNYKIKNAVKTNDDCFEFSDPTGTIEPGKAKNLIISYTPHASEMVTNAYFDIKTASGNTICLNLHGCGLGPKVIMKPNVLNFNDIPSGKTVTRIAYLQNDSNSMATFYLQNMNDTIFTPDKISGIIPPNSSIPIQFQICPTEPINYYRRIYCLIEDQDTLFLDLLATCYNEKRRPATFKFHHVQNYYKRIENGLWAFSPEQLEDMMKDGIVKCEKGILSYTDPKTAQLNSTKLIFGNPYDYGVTSNEFFHTNSGKYHACSLIEPYVDFGSGSPFRVWDSKFIKIANHTKGKMTCVWINSMNLENSIFSVSPDSLDIPPKGIAEFKVSFRPRIQNEFYGRTLEFYCYFKSMRNFRLVNEDTFTPPWCLTPVVAGNTFTPGQDTFIPKIEWKKGTVVFPASYVDCSQYQVARLTNTGDTTVKFSFSEKSSAHSVFKITPLSGVLQKNETCLFLVSFNPKENLLYEDGLMCYFNNSNSSRYELQMKGFGSQPSLSFGTDNSLNFKPTCVGSKSTRTFKMNNTSKISLVYEWQIPAHFAKLITISPMKGRMEPNAQIQVSCGFLPGSSTQYSLKIPCFFFHEKGDHEKHRSTLHINGLGISGTLTTNPTSLQFDNLLINTVGEKDLAILNQSQCDMHLRIVSYRIVDGKRIKLTNDISSGIEINESEISISARASHNIRVKICLNEQTNYEFEVHYELQKSAIVLEPSSRFLFTVTAVGIYPVLNVKDVRSEGISKTVLWQMMSLNHFNNLLAESPSDPLAFKEDIIEVSKPSSDKPPHHPYSANVNWDFGAKVVGHPPSLVKLTLQNKSTVPVDWMLSYGTEMMIMERWADEQRVPAVQQKLNFILDNSIFEITPKTGTLAAGEVVQILLSYSHEFAGPHGLPVVFKTKNGSSRSGISELTKGKEILLNLIGYTVPPSQKFLHLCSINYQFEPIPIGTPFPPIQYYRLTNCGADSVNFSIDTQAIDQINQENGFEIIKCVKKAGVIPQGGVDYLEFIFNPLQEKEYEVDLPIKVDNGKIRIITLRGRGIENEKDLNSGFRDPRVLIERIPNFPALPAAKPPIATLSLQRIDFGAVPVRSINRQIVCVSNVSNDLLQVDWKVPDIWPANSMEILPKQYQLKPREFRLFKIVFEPETTPRIYNFDVECSISNLTKMDEYLELNPSEQMVKEKYGEVIAFSNTNLNKYQPLPAIPSGSKNSGLPYGMGDKPEPITFYIGIKAQSYIAEEFKSIFNIENFWCKIRETQVVDQSLQGLEHKHAMFKDIFTQIINEIFDEFEKENVANSIFLEASPYYRPKEDIQIEPPFPIDFQNIAEQVFEGTIYNIMQEINNGEFDCTSYPILIGNKK